MDDLRRRLEHDIDNLSQELRVLRGKGIFRR
jgi:hypothetical protein